MTKSFFLIQMNLIVRTVQIENHSLSSKNAQSVIIQMILTSITQIIMMTVAHMDIMDIMHMMSHHKKR